MDLKIGDKVLLRNFENFESQELKDLCINNYMIEQLGTVVEVSYIGSEGYFNTKHDGNGWAWRPEAIKSKITADDKTIDELLETVEEPPYESGFTIKGLRPEDITPIMNGLMMQPYGQVYRLIPSIEAQLKEQGAIE